MAGLPVLNTQECDEYMQLVENEKMGLNSPAGDYVALADNMRFLIEHPQVRKKWGKTEENWHTKYLIEGYRTKR